MILNLWKILSKDFKIKNKINNKIMKIGEIYY